MNNQQDILEFGNAEQWRDWLERNHSKSTDVWILIYRKKYQDCGLTLEKAVEEALCFGWIDSMMVSIDEKKYRLRFSPRTKSSIWSITNIRRAERFIDDGKMTRYGLEKIAEAIENGEWEAAFQREQVNVIPKDLEKALKKKDGAIEAYRALPDSRKKQLIYWLQTSKQEKTKKRRIQLILKELLRE